MLQENGVVLQAGNCQGSEDGARSEGQQRLLQGWDRNVVSSPQSSVVIFTEGLDSMLINKQVPFSAGTRRAFAHLLCQMLRWGPPVVSSLGPPSTLLRFEDTHLRLPPSLPAFGIYRKERLSRADGRDSEWHGSGLAG